MTTCFTTQSYARCLLVILATVVLSSPVKAQLSNDLYLATVPVTDHSPGALRIAVRDGLGQVFVKLSGSEETLTLPEVREALSRSNDFLQQYQYRRTEDGELQVAVHYDSRSVLSRMTEARAPLWTGPRPGVLVWVVMDSNGDRIDGGRQDADPVRSAIALAFAERAIPVQFPLYDLTDSLQLDLHDLWVQDQLPIYRASERYDAQHVLVLRLTPGVAGEWQGDWLYLENNGSGQRSFYGADLASLANSGVALAAEKMAARYAVRPTGLGAESVYVQVAGLSTYPEYRTVLDSLQELKLVSRVHLSEYREQVAVFALQAQVAVPELDRMIQLETGLEVVDEAAADNISLQYRWP